VLNRGNERRAIFRDEYDGEGSLDRLGRCSQRFGLRVLGNPGRHTQFSAEISALPPDWMRAD
jgi:hypothetical protein